jgi:hypothetical protein
MKNILSTLLSVIWTLSAQAADMTAAIQGEIQLKYSESSFAEDTFKKDFGNAVKATCNWYAGDFFGKPTIFAGITVTNSASKPMFFQYYVAFFDKEKNLVGTASQGSFGDEGLKPEETTQMGSCLIHLPKDKYKEIASYQAVIYETDAPPKEK